MGNRNHRPFEDLTWAQCCFLRAVVTQHRWDLTRGRAQRAFRGLMGKREQLITSTGCGIGLTPAGVQKYNRMVSRRPDLFKEV